MLSTSKIAAQGAAPESVTKGFTQVADWIAQSAESVPAERYTFKPTDGVRTFAQLVGHIVEGYRYYCRQAEGPVEWTDTVEKTVTTKADLLKNFGHSNLHYGNMIVYLRLMGIVPASSR